MSKRDITPTDREIVMREDDFIVSKTDLKGRITYGNRIFIEFSGFEEREVIGTQHNLVHHPDMPRGIFKLLWGSVQDNKEIFAYVKNISRDGSYYWVLANVTPSVDASGNTVGYYSVRRKPNPRAIPIVTQLYRDMLSEERSAGSRDAIAASHRVLDTFLKDKKQSYENLVLSLQSL